MPPCIVIVRVMSSSLKLRTLRHQQELSEELKAARLPTRPEAWLLTFTTLWFTAGLFTDGWAHNHIPELETFFTPWHAVFYSGYFATALALAGIVWRNAKRLGVRFRSAAPIGYEYALFGASLFIFGGIGDLLWHEIFGIEADIEALLSPTHLVLAVAMFLMVSANLRAWFKATPPLGKPKFADQLPMILSVAMSVALLWFMLQFSHFITVRAGIVPDGADSAESLQNIAITGYLLHVVILLAFLFLLLRRGRIAGGAITIISGLSMTAMGAMRDGLFLLPAVLVTGVIADILAARLHPLEQHRREFRAFAFAVPAIFFTAYFLTVHVQTGIAWSVHLWTGSIVMTGLAGLLLSFLVLPPSENAVL